jgi:hypothetical protein
MDDRPLRRQVLGRLDSDFIFRQVLTCVGGRSFGRRPCRGSLGFAFASGKAVQKDYRRAAEKGNQIAQYNLGFMFSKGLGVTRDPSQADEWYRKVCRSARNFAAPELRQKIDPKTDPRKSSFSASGPESAANSICRAPKLSRHTVPESKAWGWSTFIGTTDGASMTDIRGLAAK